MDVLLAGMEAWPAAQYLRGARWAYAAVNGFHIFGIALLVGAILPLDLKLLGFWPRVARRDLVRVLVPMAAGGLALAVAMGLLLFATRASEYADLTVFRAKLVLVVIGAGTALMLHARHGFLLEDASRKSLALHGVLSIACWTGALACGRLIAFAGN